jgi:ABC-type lipoprotein release transport system permease subunit
LRLVDPHGLEVLVYPMDRAAYGALCQLLTTGKRRTEKGHCALSLADVRAVLPEGSRAGAVHVRFDDALAAPARATSLRAALAPGTQVRDWTQDHANYFRAIRIEKTMMSWRSRPSASWRCS